MTSDLLSSIVYWTRFTLGEIDEKDEKQIVTTIRPEKWTSYVFIIKILELDSNSNISD